MARTLSTSRFKEIRNSDLAKKCAKQACELDPAIAENFVTLAAANADANNFDQATAQLKMAIGMADKDAQREMRAYLELLDGLTGGNFGSSRS